MSCQYWNKSTGCRGAYLLTLALPTEGEPVAPLPGSLPGNNLGNNLGNKRHPLTPKCMPDGYGADPGAHAPRYIQACFRSLWKLVTWPKAKPDQRSERCARCFSWRHGGPCQQAKAAQDYSRMKETLEPLARDRLAYVVLTLDPSAWTGSGWSGPAKARVLDAVRDRGAIAHAYAELCARWTQLIKRLRQRFGALEYVATVECHKSGWPHLNVVLYSSRLQSTFGGCLATIHRALNTWTRKARGREAARRIFGDLLEVAGFGRIAFAEPAKPLDADGGDPLAGYMAKLAALVETPFTGEDPGGLVDSIDGRLVAELVKHSQVPYNAPSNFRRLRSSTGFLAPKRTNPDITGEIKTETGRRLGSHPVDKLIFKASQIGQFGAEAAKTQLELEVAAFISGRAFPLGTTDRANLDRALLILRDDWPDPANFVATTEPHATDPPALYAMPAPGHP